MLRDKTTEMGVSQMTLQRYHIGYDHTPEESAMMHDTGYWVRAEEALAEIAALKETRDYPGLAKTAKYLSAVVYAHKEDIEKKDAEIARLRRALEFASDFASSHSLPCLSDIVDTALEAK